MTDITIGGPFGRPAQAPGIDEDLRRLIARGLRALAVAYTDVGLAVINNRIIQAGTAAKLLGWGTGSTAAAVTDTDLQTESAETLSGLRVSATESRAMTTIPNDTYQLAGTITATGVRTISELGAFDAQSSGATVPNAHGNCLLHAVFAGVGLNSGDSIAFTAQLKQVASVT